MWQTVARACFGIAVAGSGALQLVAGDFVRLASNTAVAPRAIGMVLLIAGCAIAAGILVRAAAAVVAALLLLALIFDQMPAVIDNPWVGFMWTKPLKTVALAGGALVLAAPADSRVEAAAVVGLAIFLLVCGIQHFVYADFVATLVPSWIPGGQPFWADFAGVALIAGAIGLVVSPAARLAALSSAAMIFLWVLLLHIPRAVAGPRHADETAGVFEALAISAIALLIAVRRSRPPAGADEP